MKNGMRFWTMLFAVAASLLPATLAQAQWTRGYHATLIGEGRVVRRGDTDFDARRVRLELERGNNGGDVRLFVYGGRDQESLTLSGRWSQGKQDEPTLRFTRCNDRDARIEGTAAFSHNDGRLERLRFSGTAGRNDVSLNFRTRNADGNGNGNGNGGSDTFSSMDVRAAGGGTLSIGSDRWPITAVRVELQRGGAARITLTITGRRDEVLTGRWTGRGEDIGISIDGGTDDRLGSPRGSLNRRVKTGGFDRLMLTGLSGRQAVTISFRAD